MDGREDIVQYVVLRVCGREERKRRCASGSVVEYRLAKARVAGSNPVSRSLKPLIFQGFLFLCCTACCSRECRKAQIFIFLEKTIDIFVIL